jgi:M6 family metalloprotease-like protein
LPAYPHPLPSEWLTVNTTLTNTVPVKIPMIVAEVGEGTSENELITVASHELGHMIGAPDHYYGNYVGMGPWDLMAFDWDFFHFGAWTKLDRGWIDWVANTTVMPCQTGSCEITTVLDPQEIKGNNALLIPKYFGPEFVGIMAECRKKINGDEGIPEEGVLFTLSNPYLDYV